MTKKKKDRILVVDDEELVAKVLELHMGVAGYEYDWAVDGEEALKHLASCSYALVLLDICMPGMNGVEVLEHMKDSGSDAAVIMMSGHGSEDIAVKCMKSGAVDYVTKPFDLSDVLQRIEQALVNRATLLEKQRLEREKDDFISMLSHDMKNPLTAAIGTIDITREGCLGPVNDEQAEYLQSAIDSCNEVVSMIDNLLSIYRFEAGRLQLVIQPCDPGDILLPLANRFSLLAKREGIELIADLEPKLPNVAVDRNAFSRTIGNLLGNAIKFTPEEGDITFSCHPFTREAAMKISFPDYAIPHAEPLIGGHERFVRISVKDTGSGIPREDQGKIFERFVQSRREGKNYGGAGLGLAYCKLVVEKMDGVIWVVSEPDRGSEFIILLPALDEDSANG